MDLLGITTFILRIITSLFILGISYKFWNLFNKISRSKLSDLFNKITIIFFLFGVVRLIMAFPDIYLGGLFSNIINSIIFGWFFYILFNVDYQILNEYQDNRKLSEKIDEVINELSENKLN